MSRATRTVYTVLYHVADDHPSSHAGAAGDGSFTARFKTELSANDFAVGRSYYGKPATVQRDIDVPVALARRWGVA